MGYSHLGNYMLIPHLGGLLPPAAPTGLAITGASGGLVAVLTPEATADAVAGATSYEFELALTSVGLTGEATVTGQATPAYTFSTLLNFTSYDVAIRAVNAVGPGPWSSAVTVQTNVFTQALGSDLLTNGAFSTWSGDNPTGWSISGESGSDPMVTEVAAGGGAGTGAARLYSSATASAPIMRQTVLTADAWYEIDADLSAYTSGNVLVQSFGSGMSKILSAVADYNWQGKSNHTIFQILLGSVPADLVFNAVSVKLVTLNAKTVLGADGTFDFFFTAPASPKPHQRVQLWYRESDSTDNKDYWTAYIERNVGNTDWDFKLDRVSNAMPTNAITVTGVGAVDGIRVVASGNDHTCFTSADNGDNWTQRGTTQTNSTHATNTRVRPVYNSNTTPGRVRFAA